MRHLNIICAIFLILKETAALCGEFAATHESYTQEGPTSQLSHIVHCPEHPNPSAGGCKVEWAGTDNVYGYTNLTGLSPADISSIFHTIQMSQASSNTKFPPGACQSVKGFSGFTVPRGQNGFVSFTPTLNCVKGVLNHCSDGPVRSKTYVTACAPQLLADTADGTFSLVVTNYRDPSGNYPALKAKCEAKDMTTNTGISLLGGWRNKFSAWSTILAVTILGF